MTSPLPLGYIGRFAPSPTGSLHLGSVYTALASFLDARAQGGAWKLRFDDLDTPRNVKGAVGDICRTLEQLGLYWDGEVDYQSQHLDEYEAILADLIARGRVYCCACSRKNLAPVYDKTCRHAHVSSKTPHSLRLRVDAQDITVQDALHGRITRNVAMQDGDFILKRKDAIIAYQFAVVIDDRRQGVTDVVRGMDLLNETPKQCYLQQCLGFPTPNYLHVPLLVDNHGKKLSKTTFARRVETPQPSATLCQLLHLLGQTPPAALQHATVDEILNWATAHWDIATLSRIHTLSVE